ncbi:MAG TPA: hypothetical protein VG412_13565 [Acidimicrobiales bacterium]|nr:hypothetical protein [Acidimicrobiales bacterium]
MNRKSWERRRASRTTITVAGIIVAVAAVVGLGTQAVSGARTVNAQRQTTTVRNATIDDEYYQCLDIQARSLISSNQSVAIDTANLGDFISLLKSIGSWATFAGTSSGADVRLSLRAISGPGGCRGSVVVADFAVPLHGVTQQVGTGASMPGHGPPPAPPL